jgi:hypothetical protein
MLMRPGPDDTQAPLRVTFKLSPGEFAKSWLGDYYRQRGMGQIRRLAGPALMALGLTLRAIARGEVMVTAAGSFFFYYGIYYIVRPFLLLAFAVVRRGGGSDVTLELDDRGVRLSDPSSLSKRIGWDVVDGGGELGDYAWVEIRGGTRITIPKRAFADAAAFEACLREHGKWRG